MKNISEVAGVSVLVLSCLTVNQAMDLFSAQHVGRRYDVPNPQLLGRDAALHSLRDKLQEAIQSEEFETAASLRDQIRTLE